MKTIAILVLAVWLGGCDSDSGVPQSVVDGYVKVNREMGEMWQEHKMICAYNQDLMRVMQSRISRLTADSARCAEDRMLGWPSYSRCMNYCGRQWTETTLGDTIWGCVDSIHFATKRYYTERKPEGGE